MFAVQTIAGLHLNGLQIGPDFAGCDKIHFCAVLR